MLTLLHASDLHFGKPFDEEVAGVFHRAVQELSPHLLVLSGDFTQRAKVREYREAREFLNSLPEIPVVVTPGNHDVPLYRVWERIFRPLKNYREFISPELDSVTRVPGATVVSLDSTAPHRAIVNGHLAERQLVFAARAFEGIPPEETRVVVFHHPLAPAPDYESGEVLPGFQRCLDAFLNMRVDLILGGHLHRAYVATSSDLQPSEDGGEGIVLVHSGTATSTRGRARERNKNSFNLIRITRDQLVVSSYQVIPEAGGFAPVRIYTFPRGGGGFLPTEPESLSPDVADRVNLEERGDGMSPYYRSTEPGPRENLRAGLVAGGLAAAVAAVSFYFTRLLLSREPLEPLSPTDGSGLRCRDSKEGVAQDSEGTEA